MDGGVDLCHLFIIAEVIGYHEHILANGAVDGERRVEHECCLHGTIDVLISIRDGDGAHGCGKPATDASHYEGGYGDEREQLRPLEVPPVVALLRLARLSVKPVDGIHHEAEEQDEDNVVHGLGEEDAEQIVLVGELLEHSGCRAPHGVLEVDGIAEVGGQCQTIDDDEHPATYLTIGMRVLMERQEHQQDVGDIGDEDG